MNNLNERQQSFEAKYAHDSELRFKIESRAVRLFGAWVAETLGISDKKAYEDALVAFNLKEAGLQDVLNKTLADLAEAGLPHTLPTLDERLTECLHQAETQLSGQG